MDAIESIQEEIILMQLDLNMAFKTCTDHLTYDGCHGCIYCDKGRCFSGFISSLIIYVRNYGINCLEGGGT